jgi:aspartyl-tRNA(Asn)/glutamyl-tRNA(Gln) amidotransferase subunit A
VTALRPTYGVLSRYGVTAMASSLDQVGPIAASAADIALAFSVMTGRDAMDSTSSDVPGAERLRSLRPGNLKGLRIGLPMEYFGGGLDRGVQGLLTSALQVFADRGAEILEVSLPHTKYAIDTYYLLCTSEVSSNLSRFDGVRYGLRAQAGSLPELIAETRDQGFGTEVKRRILLGAFCLSKGYYDAFYLKALKARTLIAGDFRRVFETVDVLATPVSPGTAFPFGTKTDDPLAMYLADVFTVTAPLAGIPCLSMPAGITGGLPAGIQLIGPAFSDVMLLETAHAFQSCTRHHLASPPLSA